MGDERRVQCPECGGSGIAVEYVGLDMRPVEAECWKCGGIGSLARPTPPYEGGHGDG